MLFMGEEYGEKAPFQYFTSHSDPDLIEAVRRGRLEEFDDFDWEGEPPDPHDEETFHRSKLRWESQHRDEHQMIARSTASCCASAARLRRCARSISSRVETHADEAHRVLLVRRDDRAARVQLRRANGATVEIPLPSHGKALIDTGAKIEGGKITLPPSSLPSSVDRRGADVVDEAADVERLRMDREDRHSHPLRDLGRRDGTRDDGVPQAIGIGEAHVVEHSPPVDARHHQSSNTTS